MKGSRIRQKVEMKYIVYEKLEEMEWINHFFSTRIGGVSKGVYQSWNLSFQRGDKEESVRENFRRAAEILGTKEEDFVFTDQTHTNHVRIVEEGDRGKGMVKPKDYKEVDGFITNTKGLVLTTFYADCVPLFFVDPVHKAIGLSHSGWRGTADEIGRKTVEKMGEAYGTEPKDLIAVIGPSICGNCYEVGWDVGKRFPLEAIAQKEENSYYLDLWKANKMVLQKSGIPDKNIVMPDFCTCCHKELFYSHRAMGGKRGSLAAFLTIKS